MSISEDTLRLQRRLNSAIRALTDDQTRALVKAWVTAWDEVAPDLHSVLVQMLAAGDEVTIAQLRRSTRLQSVLAHIATQLETLGAISQDRILADLRGVIDEAGEIQTAIIASQLPPAAAVLLADNAWARIDPRQVDAIVARSTQQITALHRPLSRAAYLAVERELIRGIASGSNPKATAARMVRRAEQAFNGGLTRALTISRTETLDAYRSAAQLGQKQHTSVLTGWVWVAALSDRTCPACLGMHGTTHPISEPGPLGHQQCRCARVPQTKSWADLGFDIEEPPSAVPDADAFFDSLSPLQQRDLLGPARYQAWLAGDFPREQWAVRRTNSGWRDSYVSATPPASGSRSRSAAPPPPITPTPPAPAADGLPAMGRVLGTTSQQRHSKASAPRRPAPRGPNADWAWTFVPGDQDRTTALLQYVFDTEQLVKKAAAAIADGRALGQQLHGDMTRFHGAIVNHPMYGVTGDNYTIDDLKADVIGAAHRLIARDVVDVGTVFKGIHLEQHFDLATDAGKQQALAALNLDGWRFTSASPDADLAHHYARSRGSTPIVLIIEDAQGVVLDSMGRMSPAPEVLLSGGFRVEAYHERNGVLIVKGRWSA